jgi:pantoate kinase
MTEYTQVTAFCPGHISGYFRPYITGNSLTSGSIGAGVVIDSGVVVTATTAEKTTVQILQQGPSNSLILIAKDSPVIRDLLDDLHVTADVKTRCHLPLSSGYGLSAAALLATVHAINALMDLRLSEEECANRAHAIEVKHRTGLGDVSACQGGG